MPLYSLFNIISLTLSLSHMVDRTGTFSLEEFHHLLETRGHFITFTIQSNEHPGKPNPDCGYSLELEKPTVYREKWGLNRYTLFSLILLPTKIAGIH